MWSCGLESLEEIFEWVLGSKYFNPDSFRSMNHEHRYRATKRLMYQKFIEYIFRDEQNLVLTNANEKFSTSSNLQLESLEHFSTSSNLQPKSLDHFGKLDKLKNMVIKVYSEFI